MNSPIHCFRPPVFLLIIFLSLISSFPYSAFAENGALSEEEFFADIPVVLTATRLKQPISKAPASMTIIDRHMIEASGARDIVDVLKLAPGFQVQHENGHTPIVTYHGMSDQFSRWMQVLVDGRSIYTPYIGGVEWSQIPLVLDEVERIEVTRGPNAASYGSNAFAATINIITKHTSETNGTFFRLTAGEPNNLRDALLQYGENVSLSKGNLNYRLTLGRLSDDGFTDRNDDMEANLARFRMDYNDGGSNTWFYTMGYINGPRGLDYGNNYEYPERNYERDIEYNFQQLRWTHDLSGNEEFYINYYRNSNKVDETPIFTLTANPGDEYFWTVLLPGVTVTNYNSYKTDRHDLEVQHTLVPNENWRIAWGGSLRQDQFYSPGYIASDSTEYINLSRVFANSEWHATQNLNINAGAMWENSQLTGTSLSPRLGAVYQLTNNHNLRGVVSKATRIPSIIEYDGELLYHLSGPALTGFGLPDPSVDTYIRGDRNLDNEKITSYEIGLNSQYPGTNFSTDIKIYQDRITDIVYFALSPDPITDTGPIPLMVIPKNGGDVTITGLEFQADLNHSPDTRIVIAYSLTDIVENTILADNDNSGFEDTAAQANSSLLFSQRLANKVDVSFYMSQT
ncbi:MAG: TonB-dependent receptor, partial [Gammaproteobacteria bacterium]|nr:TonB-dependent receptor [Gammaproteobacteria bacterium]